MFKFIEILAIRDSNQAKIVSGCISIQKTPEIENRLCTKEETIRTIRKSVVVFHLIPKLLKNFTNTHEKTFDSDWLRAVQITHHNSGLWLTKRQYELL